MIKRAAISASVVLACGGQPGASVEPAPKSMPEAQGPEGHGPEKHHPEKHHPAGHHPEGHGEHGDAEARADHRGQGHHKHHRFDDAARWSQQFDAADRAAWQKPDLVVSALGLTPAMKVADLGAGTGYFTVRLARAVPEGQVIAEDIEPDMVRHIAERAQSEGLKNVQTVQGEADDPKLPAGLDAAIMVDTYHHVDDPAAFFARVRDALRPGGLLVIVDFKKDAPEDAPGPPAAMRVADEVVSATLAGVGLVHERTDRALLPYQYLVFMRRPK